MSDGVFRLVVRIYRNTKKTFRIAGRICTQEIMLFRLCNIPIYLGPSFFIIAILPLSFLFYTSGMLLVVLPLVPLYLLVTFISVLVHELGHAFFVRRCQFRVDRIFISAVYGLCRYSHPTDIIPPVSIAFGGILAQALLCVLIYGIHVLILPIENITFGYMTYIHFFLHSLLLQNIFMICINLLPVPGLDGEIIWGHVKYLWQLKFT